MRIIVSIVHKDTIEFSALS